MLIILIPIIDSRVYRNFYHLLIRRSIEGKVHVMDVTGTETERVLQEVGNTAHGEFYERCPLLYVLRHYNRLEALVVYLLHGESVLRPERVLGHGALAYVNEARTRGIVNMRLYIIGDFPLELFAL